MLFIQAVVLPEMVIASFIHRQPQLSGSENELFSVIIQLAAFRRGIKVRIGAVRRSFHASRVNFKFVSIQLASLLLAPGRRLEIPALLPQIQRLHQPRISEMICSSPAKSPKEVSPSSLIHAHDPQVHLHHEQGVCREPCIVEINPRLKHPKMQQHCRAEVVPILRQRLLRMVEHVSGTGRLLTGIRSV
jgi:hypothetical protein